MAGADLHPIGTHPLSPGGDVVFVHGFGGHWRDTWANPSDARNPWPEWLAEDLPTVRVWSLEYPASWTLWGGPEVPILERAAQLGEVLKSRGIGEHPVVFVCHSLGGLIVKSLLRHSLDSSDTANAAIGGATRGLVLFGTPNAGASLATFVVQALGSLGLLGALLRLSSLVAEMRAHRPELRDLNRWYREAVQSDRLRSRTQVYYEKGRWRRLFKVVDETSADPGIAGTDPIPLDGDHFSICKLADPNGWEYKSARRFVTECLAGRHQPRPNSHSAPPSDGRVGAALRAARERLSASRRAYHLSRVSAQPQLRLERHDKGQSELVDPRVLSDCIQRGESVILKGAPGGGKTWILLEVAEQLLSNRVVAVFVPLASWAAERVDFPTFAATELGLPKAEVEHLASAGAVAWLLDGWNELPFAVQRDAEAHVNNLVRRFPRLGVILATRNREAVPTIPDAKDITLLPLSRAQRGIIIRSADLQDPEGLIRNITEHPALDEVTRNPLFLSTAIAVWRTSSALPATIYALLATFVLDVERGIHGTELSSVAHGQHRRYLEAFAQSLIDSHTTRLSFEETLRIVARCSNALLSENAIGSCPDAIRILDALLDHHLLVRTVSGTPTIGFFHQRFQEWFGAEHLARKITGATPSAIYELQADVVNFDAWTESLLLLADRFGEEQRDDLQASLVRCVLPVDLLFAAQLCGVMSAGGWETVHEEIERPVRTLASDPAVAVREYGLAAAAATRRADFSSLVWAELREADDQRWHAIHQAVARYGVGSLGPNWVEQLSALDVVRRLAFVHSVGFLGGPQVCRAVAAAARSDDSLSVRAAAVESLMWHGFYDEAVEWLEGCDPAVLGEGQLAEHLEWMPPHLRTRILPWLRRTAGEVDGQRGRAAVLAALAEQGDTDALEALRGAFEGGKLRSAPPVLRAADPASVSRVLLARLQSGEWDDRWLGDLGPVSSTEVSQLLDAAMTAPRGKAFRIARVVAGIEPAALADRMVREIRAELDSPRPRDRSAGWSRLDELAEILRELDADLRIRVFELLGDPGTPTGMDFALRHLFGGDQKALAEAAALSTEDRDRVRALVVRWSEILEGWPDSAGWLRASNSLVLGFVARPSDVDTLLAWIKLDQKEQAGRRTVYYTNLYADALARVGQAAESVLLDLLDDVEYVGEASQRLANLALGPVTIDMTGRRWEAAATARSQNAGPAVAQHAHSGPIAAAIAQHLDRWESGSPQKAQPHALGRAMTALARLDGAATLRLMPQFLLLRQTDWAGMEALEQVALSGHVIPIDCVRPLVDRVAGEFINQRWRDDSTWSLVLRGLSLLFFSSDQGEAVTQCRRVLPRIQGSWYLGQLVERLGLCGGAAAFGILRDLLNEPGLRPDIRAGVVAAVARQPGADATDVVLGELNRAEEVAEKDERDALARALRDRTRRFPEFLSTLVGLARELTAEGNDHTCSLLVEVFEHLESDQAALASCYLLNDEDPRSEARIAWRLEEAFREYVPAGRSGLSNIQPKSSNAVRRQLFDFLVRDAQRRCGARRILIRLENARHELGRPADEPRHPDWRREFQNKPPWSTWVT